MPDTDYTPPTIDPIAAARWHRRTPTASPWLHEEVARRMQERLQWLRQPPPSWCHWQPVMGGLQAHGLIAQRYPQARCTVYEDPLRLPTARAALGDTWWNAMPWRGARMRFALPEPASVHMLWANMALHMAAQPQALLAQWQRALAVDGLVMFSCLGPDTVRELHRIYQILGWPPAAHTLTDMHDWGDMLIDSGFADPVMDMERITLTFTSAARALQELRELGQNVHPQRFAQLRGKNWRTQLERAMTQHLSITPPEGEGKGEGSQISLTFEIIYGQAFKPAPRAKVQASTSVSLEDMRQMLRAPRASN